MTADDARVALLVVHAGAGTLALVAGVVAVRGRGLVPLHVAALAVMTLTLGPSLALGWPSFAPPVRLVFLGLGALAIVMVVIGVRAKRSIQGRRHLSTKEVDQIGFNVIALTVAGTVVPMINLTENVVLVVLVTAVAMLLARAFVQAHRRPVSEVDREGLAPLARARR